MINNMKKVIGIIGCGSVTQKFYIKTLPYLSGISIDYIYDIEYNIAQIVSKIINARIVELDELIEKSSYIIIATPPHTHYNLIKKSIKQNKIVICEKPFVSKLDEAKELIKLSNAQGAKLYIAHVRRCYPTLILTKQIVESGIIGEIKEINILAQLFKS